MKLFCKFWTLIILSCGFSAQADTPKDMALPKNIILMIGDGMGPAHIKAYRVFKDNPETQGVDPLLIDEYLVGALTTDNSVGVSNGSDESIEQGTYQVTDSAASATAYSSGIRTYNGAIAVEDDKSKTLTVLELAKKKNMKTGLVATSQINHATPAAFIAHVESRKQYNEIADFFVDSQFNEQPMVDVFLGGGWKYFKRDDRDLVKELEEKSFQVITDAKELSGAGDRVAGLFADVGLPSVLDREQKHPSLSQMTEAAIKRLKNDKGFFLMVEGSQIDWASHDNDVAGMLHEMDDFNKAIASAIKFAEKEGDTLVLITADHETGGLSVGRRIENDSHYKFNANPVKNMKKSLNSYTDEVLTTKSLDVFLTELQIELLSVEQKEWKVLKKKLNKDEVFDFLRRIVNRATYTGWTTNGHTGVDVNLYAIGKGAELFRGLHPNTFIGTTLKSWLQNK
ncbi:alkaline phosphatase [Pleionea sediminis]|uniref:alkaline phosphatase n=1 Tax=Pleionea sediminis TaxID=2569479 RepID=UPI00118699C6|nr:alkaline phosphatase [Pleionea sediminis]